MNRYLTVVLVCCLCTVIVGLGAFWYAWKSFRIDVPAYNVAVLNRKTGLDITNQDEIAPAPAEDGDLAGQFYKGVQPDLLPPGRYFYNPWSWEWEVIPMKEVETGTWAVLIRK